MNLTEADLDDDWKWWDRPKFVTLYTLNPADETFNAPQTVAALDVAVDVSEQRRHEQLGDDSGSVAINQTTIALRRSQVVGNVDLGAKIVDWDGKTWYVDRVTIKSMDTRIMCVIRTG